MRSIYKISNALLGRDVDKPLPEGSDTTHAELATIFQRSFTDKVDELCCKRSQQPADDRSTEVTARLHHLNTHRLWSEWRLAYVK